MQLSPQEVVRMQEIFDEELAEVMPDVYKKFKARIRSELGPVPGVEVITRRSFRTRTTRSAPKVRNLKVNPNILEIHCGRQMFVIKETISKP